ncbi:RDD family protein [Massilia sp. W12]|uniref:RDD family protein n=1 Tax=Massilia sp. W12 TaxID=3126507 RepID=UPI0030D0C433
MSTVTPTLPAPSLRRRLMCMVYESFLLLAVIFVAAALFDILTNSRHALLHRHAREAWLFLVIGAYFIVFWRKGGQTLAMQTWRIKLTDQYGQPPRLLQLVLRYVLCWMWFMPAFLLGQLFPAPLLPTLWLLPAGFLLWGCLAFLDKERRFMHDRLAGTRLLLMPSIKAGATIEEQS